MTATTDRKDIEKLKHFLKDEMSAVESYDKALGHIKHDDAKATLAEVRSGHQTRLETLKAKIAELGGELPTDSGLWGKIASIMEKSAEHLGDKILVGTLEDCEVKSLADYKSGLEVFDEAEHKFVFSDLLPAAQESYEKINKLHQSLHLLG